MTEWIEVYSLRKDPETIEAIQRATVETEDFGLVPEHGLFGSREWWDAVKGGEIPRRTIEEVISRTYMGSMDDWPELEVDSEGVKST